MKEKFAKLINVKTIVTLILTVVFSVLSLNGSIEPSDFLMIFTVVIGFYFGTQKIKEG